MGGTDGGFCTMAFAGAGAEDRLTAEQRGLLQAAFAFRHRCGEDYYSSRLLSHFPAALRVWTQGRTDRSLGRRQPAHSLAAARNLFQRGGASSAATAWPVGPTANCCRGFAGPIAEFILTHADASRFDILDFIEHSPGAMRVSTVALHHFCKKFGLDRATRAEATAPQPSTSHTPAEPRAGRNGPSEPAGAAATSPFFSTRTQHAGAFLLMPSALDWLATAEECFADEYGSLRQGLLTSVFSLLIGMERVFHLDDMTDPGFARLCGGRRCPSRYTVGGWRRHLPWYEVDAFCRRTCPWHLLQHEDALVSFDEHTIPRWTRQFHIGKGYVTTRNKYMRCEKLFTGYDLSRGRFLSVRGTPGSCGLQELAVPLLQQTLRQGRPRTVHALFDAGAGKSDRGVRALWDFADQHPNVNVTIRACRYPHRMRVWKQLPSGLFVTVEDPGVCVGAPPKEVRLAETQTILKDEEAEQAIRTIVCRGGSPGSQEGSVAPVVHDKHGRTRGFVAAFPHPAKPRARPSRRGPRPVGGCRAVRIRQGKPAPEAAAFPSRPLANDRLAGGVGVQRGGRPG